MMLICKQISPSVFTEGLLTRSHSVMVNYRPLPAIYRRFQKEKPLGIGTPKGKNEITEIKNDGISNASNVYN